MDSEDRCYAVLRPVTMQVLADGEERRYLPLYETREQAEANADGAPIITLVEDEEGEGD